MANNQPSQNLQKLIEEASSPDNTSIRLTQLAQEKHAGLQKVIAF